MTEKRKRRFVIASLSWLISEPTRATAAGLTAYRARIGPEELFSIFVKFSDSSGSGHWKSAKIFALAEEMEARLPIVGEKLILTAGENPVAEAEIVSGGEE